VIQYLTIGSADVLFFSPMILSSNEFGGLNDVEQAARATFKVIANRVSPGESASIKALMPEAIADLWPQFVQT
jgi:uncharacterized protein (DUF2267 family)